MNSALSKVNVLITLYDKNLRHEVERCFDSLAIQTYKPDEVILVIDGPVSLNMDLIINKYIDLFSVKIVYLDENIGLGKALNIGLKYCAFDFVARIDIDDVCKPNRLEIQKLFMDENPEVSILGGQINLFDDNGVYAKKSVPTGFKEIEKWSIFRNPLNHSSVMFRRKDVIGLGGYPAVRFTQDFILWIYCLDSGLIIRNLPIVLCDMYVDKNMFARRGLNYLIYDLKPYFINYQLNRNGLFILISMIGLRAFFNFINSIRFFFTKSYLK